jgi:tRNA(Ile)-lysidine synthase
MKTGIVERVKNFITSHNLITRQELPQVVIVGLSGGPDSVFLLHALKSLENYFNIKLVAAHLDHEWRPDSHLDMLFCKNLAQELGVEFVTRKASEILLKKKYKGSQEELGRALRREFLSNVAREYNSETIALAHHADDQIETFLIRLLRGAGVAGLASIRPRSGLYIHPLLSLFKYDILDYLHKHARTYRTDPTNTSTIYLRNRIRNSVIPAIESADNRFKDNVLKAVSNLQEADGFIERNTQSAYEACILQESPLKTPTISTKVLAFLDPFIQKQVILKWLCAHGQPFIPSTAFFQEILRFLLSSRGGTHQITSTTKIIKKQHQAYLISTYSAHPELVEG